MPDAMNRLFHERMEALSIEHDYVEIPGLDHEAPAVLSALLDRGDFYGRALAGTATAAEPAGSH